MSKTTKKQQATFEQFLEAVRYLLVNEKGMPELVADEIMAADDGYLREAFGEVDATGKMAMEAADELVIRPRKSGEWVRLDDEQMLLTVNKKVRAHIESIGKFGLYGDSDEEVAATLLCRGIECVLPLAGQVHRR